MNNETKRAEAPADLNEPMEVRHGICQSPNFMCDGKNHHFDYKSMKQPCPRKPADLVAAAHDVLTKNRWSAFVAEIRSRIVPASLAKKIVAQHMAAFAAKQRIEAVEEFKNGDGFKVVRTLTNEIATLKAENDRLCEVLEVYANPDNWANTIGPDDRTLRDYIVWVPPEDGFELAKQALEMKR